MKEPLVEEEHRARPAAGNVLGDQPCGLGAPEDPLGRAALADDLGFAVGEVEVLDVELQ